MSESGIYKRHFRCTSGPLLEEVQRLSQQQDIAGTKAKLLAESLGAELRVWTSGGIAGFRFKDKPDPAIWKKPNSRGLYWPRKNSAEGKRVLAEIKDLPNYPSINEALHLVGLPGNGLPVIFSHMDSKAYSCQIYGAPAKGVIFLQVPWRSGREDEVKKYRHQKETGKYFNCELEHLMWEPSPELEEVEEWEIQKQISEWKKESAR